MRKTGQPGVRHRWSSVLVRQGRLAVSRNEGGLFRGRTYLGVRGEIHRPPKDELQRRHSPRIPSSIKNQSVEIEDD
jgi:hypothetical protein